MPVAKGGLWMRHALDLVYGVTTKLKWTLLLLLLPVHCLWRSQRCFVSDVSLRHLKWLDLRYIIIVCHHVLSLGMRMGLLFTSLKIGKEVRYIIVFLLIKQRLPMRLGLLRLLWLTEICR